MDFALAAANALRSRVRGFLEAIMEEELASALGRCRYGRRSADQADQPVVGHRHGRRTRKLTGTFGETEIAVPQARLVGEDGWTTEWKSKALRAYQRRTATIDAIIVARAWNNSRKHLFLRLPLPATT
jgi:putative transposase